MLVQRVQIPNQKGRKNESSTTRSPGRCPRAAEERAYRSEICGWRALGEHELWRPYRGVDRKPGGSDTNDAGHRAQGVREQHARGSCLVLHNRRLGR